MSQQGSVPVRAVVLAAGQGTRMKSDLPKVLHEVAGKPMVSWVADALRAAAIDDVMVVVGHGAALVDDALPEGVRTAVQEEQLGTAHATQVGMQALAPDNDDVVVVLPGDMPLMRPESISGLIDLHLEAGADATLVTSILDEPFGYGRVLRDSTGAVLGVVEQRDGDAAQLAIQEVATGVYAFRAGVLDQMLTRVKPDNSQGEFYLPDVVGLLASEQRPMNSAPADPLEGLGVNSLDQLARVSSLARAAINERWLEAGVWMLDPERVYIDADVVLEPGVRIYPDVHLEGSTTVGVGAEIGPNVSARNSRIGGDATVLYSVLRDVECGASSQVGPFAYLRPGTVLGQAAKAGSFVELKKTTLGSNAKVPHLSYMGDATIGEDANIGAGSITCNYDGYEKHATVIGARARVGSDTMLVAPVTVGEDAFTGAGSVVSKDVPDGALAVERSPQKEIPGYAELRRRRAQGHAD